MPDEHAVIAANLWPEADFVPYEYHRSSVCVTFVMNS